VSSLQLLTSSMRHPPPHGYFPFCGLGRCGPTLPPGLKIQSFPPFHFTSFLKRPTPLILCFFLVQYPSLDFPRLKKLPICQRTFPNGRLTSKESVSRPFFSQSPSSYSPFPLGVFHKPTFSVPFCSLPSSKDKSSPPHRQLPPFNKEKASSSQSPDCNGWPRLQLTPHYPPFLFLFL